MVVGIAATSAVVIGATVAIAVVIDSPTPSTTANKPPPLRWSACVGQDLSGLECTKISVPMDYGRPEAMHITIAISRHKATDPARRRGVLITNPGGPGGAGLSMPSDYASQSIGAVYDIIGMDPRGVGESTLLTCDDATSADNKNNVDTGSSRPPDSAFQAIADAARQREQQCARNGGDFRQYVTTANTARDMDRVRIALGEDKINYLGVSYGTYLGAVYGQLFPDHLDRSVLDSASAPNSGWYDSQLASVDATKANLDAWLTWTAARDNTFHLGTTPDDVRAKLDRVGAAVADNPVAGFTDQTAFDKAAGVFTRYRPAWAPFAKNLAGAVSEMDGASVDPALAASNKRAMAALDKSDSDPHGANAANGVYETVTCEWPWPTDLETYFTRMRQERDTLPYGETVGLVVPTDCTFHDHTPDTPAPVAVGPARYPQGLVLEAEGDTQTTLAGSTDLAQALGDVLIAVRDEGNHGEYAVQGGQPDNPVQPNACVDDKVNDYLVHGVLPPSRTDCATTNPSAAIPADGQDGQAASIPDLADIAEKLPKG
jgi:pimeloyl-ACP methyl ester carboxylesterase